MGLAEATPSAEGADPSVVITLVHGTFASGAPWTRPDSALRSRWPGTTERPVCFSVFEWSGGNSHRDRVAASGDLAEHLLASGRWLEERVDKLAADLLACGPTAVPAAA